MFTAYLLQLCNLVGAGFKVFAEEGTDAQHHVDFVGTVLEGECGLYRFHLQEGLAAGKSAADARHAYAVGFERIAHDAGEVGIDADSGQWRQFRIVVRPAVYAFGEAHHALLTVCDSERGEFDSAEQLPQHLGSVVGMTMVGNELRNGIVHLPVAHGQVVEIERLVVFVRFFHDI